MKSSTSDDSEAPQTRTTDTDAPPAERKYFCEEPWTGVFSVRTNGDVLCCPCYAQAPIGNVRESSMEEIWNSDVLIEMRRAFKEGKLPTVCRGQLCPPIVGPLDEGLLEDDLPEGGPA